MTISEWPPGRKATSPRTCRPGATWSRRGAATSQTSGAWFPPGSVQTEIARSASSDENDIARPRISRRGPDARTSRRRPGRSRTVTNPELSITATRDPLRAEHDLVVVRQRLEAIHLAPRVRLPDPDAIARDARREEAAVVRERGRSDRARLRALEHNPLRARPGIVESDPVALLRARTACRRARLPFGKRSRSRWTGAAHSRNPRGCPTRR